MIEDLSVRKTKLKEYLTATYRPGKTSWWEKDPVSYESTGDICEREHYGWEHKPEIIIRIDKTKAAFGVAFVFMILFFTHLSSLQEENTTAVPGYLFAAYMLYLATKNLLDRKPRIILTSTAIWLKDMEDFVSWDNVLMMYIGTDSRGDTTDHNFLLHYYNPGSDEFEQASLNLTGLEHGVNGIAIIAEYMWQSAVAENEICNSIES